MLPTPVCVDEIEVDILWRASWNELNDAFKDWKASHPGCKIYQISHTDGYSYAGRITRIQRVVEYLGNSVETDEDFITTVEPEPDPADSGVKSMMIVFESPPPNT